MACRTVCLANMFTVIERRVETAQPGKILQTCCGVAYRANRILVIGELLHVAAAARQMAGKRDRRRIVVALVAKQTRHACVLRRAVLEFRKVLGRGRRHGSGIVISDLSGGTVNNRVAEHGGRRDQYERL